MSWSGNFTSTSRTVYLSRASTVGTGVGGHLIAFTAIACTLICSRRLMPTRGGKAQVLAGS